MMHAFRVLVPLLLLSSLGAFARTAGMKAAVVTAPLVKVMKSYAAARTPASAVLTDREAPVRARQIMTVLHYPMMPVQPQDDIRINQNNWVNDAPLNGYGYGYDGGFSPFYSYNYYPSTGLSVYGPSYASPLYAQPYYPPYGVPIYPVAPYGYGYRCY